jgi:hypothetical protein
MNVVVLWNTLYLDTALAYLQAVGVEVQPEDVARLTPLGYKHINVLGRYAYTLAEPIAHGQLRPLIALDWPICPPGVVLHVFRFPGTSFALFLCETSKVSRSCPILGQLRSSGEGTLSQTRT